MTPRESSAPRFDPSASPNDGSNPSIRPASPSERWVPTHQFEPSAPRDDGSPPINPTRQPLRTMGYLLRSTSLAPKLRASVPRENACICIWRRPSNIAQSGADDVQALDAPSEGRERSEPPTAASEGRDVAASLDCGTSDRCRVGSALEPLRVGNGAGKYTGCRFASVLSEWEHAPGPRTHGAG